MVFVLMCALLKKVKKRKGESQNRIERTMANTFVCLEFYALSKVQCISVT